MKMKLVDYYKNVDELWLPTEPNRRHFRFRLADGSFVKIFDRITDVRRLQKHLIRHEPTDVYYSVSKWLNPTVISSKQPHAKYDQNAYLGQDFIVDVDFKPDKKDCDFSSFGDCKKEAAKIYDFLHKFNPELRFSGSGFHIILPNFIKAGELSEDIRHNEEKALLRITDFADQLSDFGFKFDKPISCDTRRIIKLPLTITKHKTMADIIPRDRLDNFQPVKLNISLPKIKEKIREDVSELTIEI